MTCYMQVMKFQCKDPVWDKMCFAELKIAYENKDRNTQKEIYQEASVHTMPSKLLNVLIFIG